MCKRGLSPFYRCGLAHHIRLLGGLIVSECFRVESFGKRIPFLWGEGCAFVGGTTDTAYLEDSYTLVADLDKSNTVYYSFCFP